MLGFCAVFAYKRNEISTFWTGFFYDEILLFQHKNRNFKNDDDKSSVHSFTLKQNKHTKTNNNEIEMQD
jgi:hypothetical protein